MCNLCDERLLAPKGSFPFLEDRREELPNGHKEVSWLMLYVLTPYENQRRRLHATLVISFQGHCQREGKAKEVGVVA